MSNSAVPFDVKRSIVVIVAIVAAAAVFAGLVYAVVMAANLSEPAGATVYGPTLRRLWATAAAGLTVIGVVIARLKKSGLRFRNEMEVGPGGKQVQIEDLDGNPIELFEPARH